MRNAYSNLTGEFVEAAAISHGDTAPFQIVCPCCAESVFKVARPLPGKAASEFFSHRQADKALVSECERRVGSLSASEIGARNAVGRGQSLKVFLSVIRDAIDLDWNPEVGASPANGHRKIAGLRGYPILQEFFVNTHRDARLPEWQQHSCKEYLDVLKGSGLRLDTAFAVEFQRRTALDVMRTLLTPQNGRAYGHLLRHAIVRVMGRSYVYGGVKVSGRDITRPLIQAISKNSDAAVERALASIERQRSPVWSGDNMVALLRSTIENEMLGTLLRLPYREMLVNHKAGRAPLHEVHGPDPSEPSAELGLRMVS